MLEDLLRAVAASDIAVTLRLSRLLYPLVSAAHILGIGVLVGSILALDARILGFGRSLPLAAAARLLLPFAVGGFFVAVVAGVGLFIVQPLEYVANPAFPIKMGLIVLALANVAALRIGPGWRAAVAGGGEVSAGVRLGAVVSALLWVSVLVAGRLIGFLG